MKRCKVCNGSGRVRRTFHVDDAELTTEIHKLPGLIYMSATGSGVDYDVVADCENCHKERAEIVTKKPRHGRYGKNYREFSFRASGVKLKGGM